MPDEYRKIVIEKIEKLVEENEKKMGRKYHPWEDWEIEVLTKYWWKLTPAQRRKYIIEELFQGRRTYGACLNKVKTLGVRKWKKK